MPDEAPRSTPPADTVVDDGVLRRNLTRLFLHGFLGQTGFRLLQAPTFFPTYVSLLTGSSAAVGAARAVQSLGMFVSPIFGVSRVQRRSHVKGLTVLYGSFMRLQVLLLGILALAVPGRIVIFAVWPVVFAWGLGSGLQMVVFNVLLAKTIPLHLRGRLLGLRNLLSGLTLIAVSAAAGLALERFGFPRGYGIAFLLAFVLTSLGLLALRQLEEPAAEIHPAPDSGRELLRTVPRLLRSDPDFRGFIQAQLLAVAGRGALPYYVLYFGAALGASGSLLAGLTIVYTVAQAFLSLALGALGDRFGFVRVLSVSILCWLLGSALTLALPPSLALAYGVFVLVAAGFAGILLATQTLAIEFGGEQDRPLRIATSNALAELIGTVAYAGAGILAQTASIPIVLAVSMVLHLAAVLRLGRVPDPRWRNDTELSGRPG